MGRSLTKAELNVIIRKLIRVRVRPDFDRATRLGCAKVLKLPSLLFILLNRFVFAHCHGSI